METNWPMHDGLPFFLQLLIPETLSASYSTDLGGYKTRQRTLSNSDTRVCTRLPNYI